MKSTHQEKLATLEANTMTTGTLAQEVAKAERRWANEQALASSRIEGHIPSPEFLADCEAVVEGTMTTEEAGARSLERALAADRAAAGGKTDKGA